MSGVGCKSGQDYTGRLSTVAGWGATAEGGATAHILQELGGLEVLSDNQCRARLGSQAISPDMLCAGGREGEDACQAEITTDHIRGKGEEVRILGRDKMT